MNNPRPWRHPISYSLQADRTFILTPAKGPPRCSTLSPGEMLALRAAFDALMHQPREWKVVEDDWRVTVVSGGREWPFFSYNGLDYHDRYTPDLLPQGRAFLELLDDAAQRHFGRAYNHALR